MFPTPNRYAEVFKRLFRGRVIDLGVSPVLLKRLLLIETPGYPRRVSIRWTPQVMRDTDALRIFLREADWWLNRLSADPYRRRDSFPLCLKHTGFCARCDV